MKTYPTIDVRFIIQATRQNGAWFDVEDHTTEFMAVAMLPGFKNGDCQ